MNKVLFGLCTHGNELDSLCLAPYKNTIIMNPNAVDRKVRYVNEDLSRIFDKDTRVGNEAKIKEKLIKDVFPNYDVFYDVHTTGDYVKDNFHDCIFVNSWDEQTKIWASYTSMTHVIIDTPPHNKQYTTSWFSDNGRVGITLEYGMRINHSYTQGKMHSDYHAILNKKKQNKYRIIAQFEMCVPLEIEKSLSKLVDFQSICEEDKKKLGLHIDHTYYPVFTGSKTTRKEGNYCYLNRVINKTYL